MAEPAKLLYVITDSGIGGTERVLLSLLKNLPRDRFDPKEVVVLKQKREMAAQWEALGVPVVALGLSRWPTPGVLGGLRRSIKQHKPDIVHAFLYHSIQVARMVHALRDDFRLVSSPRVNYRFAPKAALWFDKCLKKEDALTLCESEAGKKSLIDTLGYDPARVRVAWTSVDREKFKFDPAARDRLRTEWGIADGDILIGSVGRLHSQKGYDLLIDALARLRKFPQKSVAVIVGEGPERAALEAAVRAKGVNVRFTGARTDVASVYSAFDIYVQSSRYEGLSNALLEAMSVGRPAVATAVDGTMDFAKDGQNLLLARTDNPESLALALATAIERPALRDRLSENAKITAQTFSLDNMIRGFEEAYSHVRSVS